MIKGIIGSAVSWLVFFVVLLAVFKPESIPVMKEYATFLWNLGSDRVELMKDQYNSTN